MGLLDDLLGKAVPGGKISKPLILALLALLASGALTRKGATTTAPTAPTPTPEASNNPLGDLLGGLLGGGAPRGPGAPAGSGDPLGDILGSLLGGGAGGSQPGRMRAAADQDNPLGGLLGGLLGGAGGGAAAGGLLGGLGSLLEGMQKNGQGDVADSWVSGGQNRQIAPSDLSNALDPEVIRQLSRETGMDQNDILAQLSQGLPDLVNGLTPDGRVPEENELSRLSQQLG